MTSGELVGNALRTYFRAQGLPEDGGVDLPWVHFRVGPVPLAFPNIAARREAVRYHDVHHLVTGYQTDWRGEAEIGAWEVAAGCGRYWVGWLLDSGAMGFGALLWPRRTFTAFVRGRHSRSLFREPFAPILAEDVAAVRERLGLNRPIPKATARDRALFGLWVVVGLAWMVLMPLAALVVLALYLL